MNLKKINRALISVSDKSELTKILKVLKKFKVEILSSGGTYKKINRLGYKSIEISDFTNSPEILDGRVKTLHPKLYGGILFKRNNKKHQKQIKKIDIKKIDLVIVNFYPFEEAVKTGNDKKIIENIDIGGPTLVRAAAKNYEDVTVITDTSQYIALQNEMNKYRGSTSLNFRKILSRDAFLETGYYDTKITEYLNKANNDSPPPKKKLIGGNLVENLRYGENPHQGASVYSLNKEINIKQLNGKKLSYNNYNDIFTGISLSKSFTKDYSTVIIKHANPCGVALDKRKINSYLKAYECDPTSAFGGIISCNYKVDKTVAKEISSKFYEVVVANGFESGALKILKRKKNLRLIDSSSLKELNFEQNTSIMNNFLSQTSDTGIFKKGDFKVVSKVRPSNETLKNLLFTFNVCRFVKSNAIVISQNNSTIGIGSGQPSRLDSCKIAVSKMKKLRKIDSKEKVVAASDAFFPFVDGIETLVQAGVEAIIQPSGSIRDKEIINFANKTNTILVFSKTRHFKH